MQNSKKPPFPTDDQGYLLNPDDWDGIDGKWVSHFMPDEDIDDLTDAHIKVLETLRSSYESSLLPIEIKSISKITETPIAQIYRLFPSGPSNGACKMAGIPKPIFKC